MRVEGSEQEIGFCVLSFSPKCQKCPYILLLGMTSFPTKDPFRLFSNKTKWSGVKIEELQQLLLAGEPN